LAYAAILQRRLDYPVINLGFSGNGRMDRAVVDLLVEIDAAIYVIDCLPNMGPEQIRERMPLLVETVRRARPRVPILFVGDRVFGDATFIPSRQVLQQARKEVQGHVFRELRKRRIRGLHLLETANYFGDDFEGTVDGSHPNDLGSYRMANRLEPVLRRLLSRQAG
jgi:lysophospholipase L1-like esterase